MEKCYALLVNQNNPGLMKDNIRQTEAAVRRVGLERSLRMQEQIRNLKCRCRRFAYLTHPASNPESRDGAYSEGRKSG